MVIEGLGNYSLKDTMCEIKLCEDCKYFMPNTADWKMEIHQRRYAECARTALVARELGNRCDYERSAIFGCGKKARYFEARETK